MKKIILFQNIHGEIKFKFLFILPLFILFIWSQPLLSKSDSLRIRLKIGNSIILDSNLIIQIRFDEGVKILKGIYIASDSTYGFELDELGTLATPYTFFQIVYQNYLYVIPLDNLYRTANSYPEFKNRNKLKLEISREKKVNNFFGVLGYSIEGGGVSTTGYYFYKTKKHFEYKQMITR